MMEAIGPICLQVTLDVVGIGGVFTVASRTGRGQQEVIWRSVQEDGVGLASC